MFENKFTERAQTAINLAAESAMELGHNYVGTEHLLLGLIKEGEGVAAKILEANNINENNVTEKIDELIGTGEPTNIQPAGFTPRTKYVLEHSYNESRRFGHNYIGTEHILISILRERDSVAVRILSELGASAQGLFNDIVNTLSSGESDMGGQGTGDPEE